MEARPVDSEALEAIKSLVRAALRYERAAGANRNAGITGEVGEVLACHALELRLATDVRSEGFDAVDTQGKRVRIKTRRSESEGLPRDAGRLGTFSGHAFDHALLMLLDHDYKLVEIWRVDYCKLRRLVDREKRRNPGLRAFKRITHKVWPA